MYGLSSTTHVLRSIESPQPGQFEGDRNGSHRKGCLGLIAVVFFFNTVSGHSHVSETGRGWAPGGLTHRGVSADSLLRSRNSI